MAEYIDREVAVLAMHEAKKQDMPLFNDGLMKGADIIISMTAADVVEVVHASWVWNPDGMDWGIGAWVCSKCKSRPGTWWNTVKESHPLRCSGSRYCGNCGAVMDGGQDDV